VVAWFRRRQEVALERLDTPSSDEVDRNEVISTLRARRTSPTLPTEHMNRAQNLARKLLAERGIVLEEASGRQFWLAVRLVHRALLEETRRALARYEGRLDEPCYDELFRGAAAAPSGRPPPTGPLGPRITLG
jgi:hypothetical protein